MYYLTFLNTKDPCMENYRSSVQETEKKTKAVTGFLWSHLKSTKAYITIRAYFQRLSSPCGDTSASPPNHEELANVGKIGTDVLSAQYETRSISGPVASTTYPTSGSSLDGAYNLGIGHTSAFELRDRGKSGFLIPESQLRSTWKETVLAVKSTTKYILKRTS